MNLRCTYCQTPFTVGRLEKLAAIQHMQAENLQHYDFFCPRCRRATSVSRPRLESFTPGWQEGLKTLEAEAAKIEKERPAEPVAAPAKEKKEPDAAESRSRHHHKAAAAPVKAETPKAKPAATSSPKGKKPAAKTTTKASTAKAKPAATSSPKGKKPAAKKK